MDEHLVFVYGTLKSGWWNHERFFANNPAVVARGSAMTIEKFSLYTDKQLPYLCEAPETSRIVGEVYAVDNETLERLDRLEGHPRWYNRQRVKVAMGLEILSVWCYIQVAPIAQIRGAVLIPEGEFKPEHCPPYQEELARRKESYDNAK